ncbi:D-Ala-D-Ala carboxypeptidase family metallohydrolase [Solicola sp. PLA-1-18]|uniref:D-Ala-D-Ala carboxypeptidase family metallohydrolase n=1 Tax=Solicola sp. PLA-1-18 TaxID=3380532 RepID=UPI003B76F007
MTRLLRSLAALVLVLGSAVAITTVSAAPAQADGCYSWGRTLSEGASGEDVRQLQVRVAGWPTPGTKLGLDGQFGPATKAAVTRFQQAYGLGADGVAGSATFAKIYELQDDDCTPVNFTYDELNNCNADWSGGATSAAAAREASLVIQWQLQALRKGLGDRPLVVNGGFRSYSCNSAVGGAASSRHLYGDAADLGAGSQGFCTIARAALNHGFGSVLGPGFPGHDDHVHLDRGGSTKSAPTCGIG